MKDARVTIFRKTLEELIDSLDATVRLSRWSGAESVPEPLKDSAARLVSRLGTADRLASGHFQGSVADVARVNELLGAMRRLDAAYVDFRHHLTGPANDRDTAASALHAEIDRARTGAL